MPTTPLIAYAHVGKTFDGGRVLAVDDVSLEVAEGEFLAIVGGSGSGKTTLLRLANRLIEADAGTITVEGEDVRSVDPILLRRRIGYVFQSGGLFPHLSVANNIGITPKLLGTPSAEISARVDELLDLVRLDRAQYRDRLPHELSGGQRQRVGVARALAARPRIVLMDEPFGALDAQTREVLQREVDRIWRATGCTIVFVTHDIWEAILLADRIVTMTAGPRATVKTIEAVDLPHPRRASRAAGRSASSSASRSASSWAASRRFGSFSIPISSSSGSFRRSRS
jgi:osmoprotectant transport system ATP-binding protein